MIKRPRASGEQYRALFFYYIIALFVGHKDVWHGSIDIVLGRVAVISTATPSGDSDSCCEESGELEESRNQLVAETITFSYFQRTGLVPTIGASKKAKKCFCMTQITIYSMKVLSFHCLIPVAILLAQLFWLFGLY